MLSLFSRRHSSDRPFCDIFDGPTELDPCFGDFPTHSCPSHLQGSAKCHGSAAVNNDLGRSPIARLLDLRAPAAIARLVIPIVVNAIYAVRCRWLWSHIRKEFCEVPPFTTKSYPAPSIAAIFRVVRIGASLDHLSPCFIFRGFPHAVPKVPFRGILRFHASARFSHSTSKVIRTGDGRISAIAEAIPSRVAGCIVGCSAHDKKSSKPKSCHGLKKRMSHYRSPQTMACEGI